MQSPLLKLILDTGASNGYQDHAEPVVLLERVQIYSWLFEFTASMTGLAYRFGYPWLRRRPLIFPRFIPWL